MPSDAPTRARRRTELLIAFGILLIVGPLIQQWHSQPASRYLLTVAAIDDHSLELDPYEAYIGIDQARYRDHLYSDKAPYQPLLAAPFYGAYRLAGGDAFPPDTAARGVDALLDSKHVGLWWVTLWSSTIPAIFLILLLRRMIARDEPGVATPVALAMLVGTLLLPFSSLLFAHVLSALLIAATWHLLRDERGGARAAAGAGICLGLGIGTDYSLAALAVVFLVIVAWSRNVRRVAALCLGTVIATLPLMLYNYLVFENPFEVAYQGHLPNFQGAGALGVYNLKVPRLEEIERALVGDRGLFLLNPLMLMAFAGCVLAWRVGGRTRRDSRVAVVCFLVMLTLSTGIDGIGGASPGPRYLIPAIPLFALPLAQAWKRYPFACIGTTIIGAVTTITATITAPLDPGLSSWLRLLRDGNLVTNVFTGHGTVWPVVVGALSGLAVLLYVVANDAPAEAEIP